MGRMAPEDSRVLLMEVPSRWRPPLRAASRPRRRRSRRSARRWGAGPTSARPSHPQLSSSAEAAELDMARRRRPAHPVVALTPRDQGRAAAVHGYAHVVAVGEPEAVGLRLGLAGVV